MHLRQRGSTRYVLMYWQKIKDNFYAGYCDDDATMAAIKAVNDDYSYVMDPHTAVGKCVYEQYAAETGDTTKTVIASTDQVRLSLTRAY